MWKKRKRKHRINSPMFTSQSQHVETIRSERIVEGFIPTEIAERQMLYQMCDFIKPFVKTDVIDDLFGEKCIRMTLKVVNEGERK